MKDNLCLYPNLKSSAVESN